ncbi:hypothetical protein [Hasllibacter sp. MH4015]|uniref:hypothetical protein n=1 Tax=Hasllibacter sp. MH4015 TaxID=2854029 RepID=UPI001CD434CF|nr:hypothetical protein [Hasllibacter sp. MH4015]
MKRAALIQTSQTISPPQPGGATQPPLALIRVVGARCRVMARGDLFRACAMLSADRTRAAEAVATALLRAFDGLDGMPRLRLYQPGATERSFDEDWLLAALAAAERGDADSVTFLVARRVPRHARRQIAFLVRALAAALASDPIRARSAAA